MDEYVFNATIKKFRNGKGQFEGRVILAVFNGTDGLPRNMDGFGKGFLIEPDSLSHRFYMIFQGCPSFRVVKVPLYSGTKKRPANARRVESIG